MNENLIQHAVQNRFRFQYNGNLTTENLFDLSYEDLTTLHGTLMMEAVKSTHSLMPTTADPIAAIKADVVRLVFELKKQQDRVAEDNLMKGQKKERMQQVLLKKDEDDLLQLDRETLIAMIEAL
jgi:hypothetical protein